VQEAKLKQWQSPQRSSSTLDNFAAASGYGSFAADAMARVRARLAGFEDDDTLNMQQQSGVSGEEREAAADTRQRLQGGCSLLKAL
jgi:CO dehydrogenase/acetyl-CoA synthase delta subunit